MRLGGGQVITIALVAAIVAVLTSLAFGRNGATQLVALRAERQRLGAQAVALLAQNAALREQIEQLKSDDGFLERLARRELGMVRPGEVVYRFRRPPSEPRH